MSSGERQRRPSAHYVKNINGLDDKKLTLKTGIVHQLWTTLLCLKALVLIIPLGALSAFALNALFKPSDKDAVDGTADNVKSIFAAYAPIDRGNMMWFIINGVGGGLRVHYLSWGFMQYVVWAKRQTLLAEILATLTFFTTVNGTIGIVTSISSTEIGFWNVVFPVGFLSFAASTTASLLGQGYSVCAALKAGVIHTAVLFGMQFLILLFIIANLQIESETTRAIISGFVYPAGEVLLKFIWRKVCLGHHETVENDAADTEIKDQAYIYLSRNLEVTFAKPNFYLMYLLKTQSAFMAALAMASLCEICGLLVSNMRFTKMGQDIKAKISKRKVAAEADMSSNDPTASSIADEARQLEMEKNLEELAILRNGEEIGEKTLILTVPAIIMVMIWCGIVQDENLSIGKLCIRAFAGFVLEFAVDAIKMRVDAMFKIHDHLVRNRMTMWDIVNIATIGMVAEFNFLLALVYVQTMV